MDGGGFMVVPGFVDSVRVYGDGCSNWVLVARAYGTPIFAAVWGMGEMGVSEAFSRAFPLPLCHARELVEGRAVAAEWSRSSGFSTTRPQDFSEGDVSWG